MTNHTFFTQTPDGEVFAVKYLLEVRHGTDEVEQILNEEGWESAAQQVCWRCRNHVPPEEQEEHDCTGRGFEPSTPGAPV